MASTVMVTNGSVQDFDYIIEHWSFDKLTLFLDSVAKHNKEMNKKTQRRGNGREVDVNGMIAQMGVANYPVKKVDKATWEREVKWQGEPINKRDE